MAQSKLYINFLPESNLQDYSKEIKEYEKLWDTDGEKIVKTIEKISNLKFQETEINAMVYYGNLPPQSKPLCLIVRETQDKFLRTLVHELGHRIISGNVRNNNIKQPKVDVHKTLDLILYDIWIELYGKKFADNAVEREKKIPSPGYKEAWEWALSFTKEERAKKFKELVISIK